MFPINDLKNNLSTYSVKENSRVSIHWDVKTEDHLAVKMQQLKMQKSGKKFNQKSINDMVLKLERISRNSACGIRTIEMFHNDEIQIDLVAKENQLLYVNVFENFCPLNVFITKKQGKIEVYTSKKVRIPSKVISDQVTTGDQFKISDPGYKFFSHFVYMNIFCLASASFKVKVWFGQKPLKKIHYLQWKQKDLELESEDSMFDIHSIDASPVKDFVTFNKTEAFQQVKPETGKLEKKIAQIKHKRIRILESTQSQKFLNLHKSEIKAHINSKICEFDGILQRKTFFEKNWLIFVYRAKFLKKISEMLLVKKKSKMAFKKILKSVILIQGHVKKYLYRGGITKLSMKRCRNHLKLFSLTSKKLMEKDVVNIFCQRVFLEKKLERQSKNFENLIKAVELIQKHWFYFKVNEEVKAEEILNSFQSVISERIHHYTKLKNKAKNKKKCEKILKSLKEIPLEFLSDISKKHLTRCKKSFISKLQKYFQQKSLKFPKKPLVQPTYLYLISPAQVWKILEPLLA